MTVPSLLCYKNIIGKVDGSSSLGKCKVILVEDSSTLCLWWHSMNISTYGHGKDSGTLSLMCIERWLLLTYEHIPPLWQWYKLDELFEQERNVRTAMTNRAGLLALMLHQTIQHDPLTTDLRSNKDR